MPRKNPTSKIEEKKPLMESKPGGGQMPRISQADFGIHESDDVAREYASRATLNQDPGGVQVRANDETDGRRDAGVGQSSGAGANSGGDIDTDIVGVGTGGIGTSTNISTNPIDGPDIASIDRPKSDQLRKAQRRANPPRATGSGGSKIAQDSSLDEEGADAIRTDAGRDDPFHDATVGEVSSGEASGTDSSSSSAKR